jgi:hypothetical protein
MAIKGLDGVRQKRRGVGSGLGKLWTIGNKRQHKLLFL